MAEQARWGVAGIADEFFAAAVVRAAGGSARYLGPVAVEPGSAGEWRVRVEVPGGLLRLRCASAGEAYRRGHTLGWSYEPSDPSTDAIAARLCERLARDPTPVPADLHRPPPAAATTASAPTCEVVLLRLPGACDRACVFCQNNDERLRPRALPSVHRGPPPPSAEEVWPALTARLHELAPRADEVRLAWSGEDCLASPLFDQALALASSLGFSDMWIQSPGTRLASPGFAASLAAAGVAHVNLTAHAASEALFDEIGGKPGAHALFWAALTEARAAGIAVGVNVPIIPLNLHELPALLARLVAEPITIELFFWHPDPEHEQAYDALPLAMGELTETFEAIAAVTPPRTITVVGIPACHRPASVVQRFAWAHTHHARADTAYAETCARCRVQPACIGLPPGYLRRQPAPSPIERADDPRAVGESASEPTPTGA